MDRIGMVYRKVNQGYKCFGRLGLRFRSEAEYRRYNLNLGRTDEEMNATMLKTVCGDLVHRQFNSHKPDYNVPSLSLEAENKMRTYDYKVTNAHVWDVINKAWSAKYRVWVVSRYINLSPEQREALHRAGIRVMLMGQLMRFLARLKLGSTEPLKPVLITMQVNTIAVPTVTLDQMSPMGNLVSGYNINNDPSGQLTSELKQYGRVHFSVNSVATTGHADDLRSRLTPNLSPFIREREA